MSEEPATSAAKDKPVNPTVVGIMMTLVALFGPLVFSFLGYNEMHISVTAVLWIFASSPYYTYLDVANPSSVIAMMPFGFIRLAYAYQMFRFYKGRTTKKRTLTLGIVSELPFAILSIPFFIMWILFPYGLTPLTGPTPILLIVSILIIRFKPPLEPSEIWEELPTKKPWWVGEPTHS